MLSVRLWRPTVLPTTGRIPAAGTEIAKWRTATGTKVEAAEIER